MLCNDLPDSVLALQEHWLKPPYKKHCGTNQLRFIHDSFDGYGTSAMKKSMESVVRIGRPFGGMEYIWNKKLSLNIRPRIEYIHEKVTVLEILNESELILCINAYMPFYDIRKLDENLLLYNETISFVSKIIVENRNCSFVICMDMNCNIFAKSSHPHSVLIQDLMNANNLISTFECSPTFDFNTAYTHVSKGKNNESKTLFDGILISCSLVDKN